MISYAVVIELGTLVEIVGYDPSPCGTIDMHIADDGNHYLPDELHPLTETEFLELLPTCTR
jgi:hypothetical protein